MAPISGRTTYRNQVAFEQQLVAASLRDYTLSKMRLDAGIDSYLTVLVAQSSLFGAQINQVALRLAEQQNLITLYKSLGGGWTEGVGWPSTPAHPPCCELRPQS